MNTEEIIQQILNAISSKLENDIKVSRALDSYDVLSQINDACGNDLIILDVGDEDALGDYPELGIVDLTFDIIVARSFGLSEISSDDFFARTASDEPLYTLRDKLRDIVRALIFDNIDNMLESARLRYLGSKRFETAYNLRAAAFKCTFKLTGSLPFVD